MAKGKSFFIGVLVLQGLLVSSVFGATNRDVCLSGCAYSSIQAALNAAEDGDTLRVAQGLYYENLSINNPITVTIQGGWDATFSSRSSDPSLTIVDGMGLDNVFYIFASNDQMISVHIEGLTIRNGADYSGGGIYVYCQASNSSTIDSLVELTLTNNHIVKNHASSNGGGLYAYTYTSSDNGSAKVHLNLSNNRIAENLAGDNGGGIYLYGYTSSSYSKTSALRFNINNNEINGNRAEYGGGAYVYLYKAEYEDAGASSSIQANDISGNTALGTRGGLYVYFNDCLPSILPIVNNVIAGNWSKSSPGGVLISSYGSSPSIDFINNTIALNSYLGFEAVSDGYGGVLDNFVLNFSNNIVYGNQVQSDPSDDVDFDNYSDGNMVVTSSNNSLGGLDINDVVYNDNGGNLTTDPLLGDDFHLLAGSPAINSADATLAPATDKDGNARSGDPDRGAYEYLGSDHQAQLPLPDARYEVLYKVMRGPTVASDPLVARPFTAFIDSSNILRLNINLPEFSSGVDLYAGVFIPTINPDNVYQIAEDDSLRIAPIPIKWKSAVTTAVQKSSLWGDLDITGWPRGEYFLYLISVPEGGSVFGGKYYSYHTSFYVK